MAPEKPNNPGLGIEYEVYVPAYFALRLNDNSEIVNFEIKSNVPHFDKFDDLLVDIKTRSGENLYFAFQLKHKENPKKMINYNFDQARKDFNLEEYCKAFKSLNEENRKKYNFILYTNKNFSPSDRTKVTKFSMKMEKDEESSGRSFFNTRGDGRQVYKFQVTENEENVNKDDFQEFFSQFRFYTGQANIRDLEKSILDILKHKECCATYIDFFRRWHRGDFIDKTLDKNTLNIHLLDIFLSSVAINYHLSDGQVGNSNFFETMVRQFDVTIIDASKQDFIKLLEENVLEYPEEFKKTSDEMIKIGKKSKLIDRFTKELNEETKLKLSHYIFKNPLILDFNENTENLIYEASRFVKESRIKLVIVGRRVDESKFSSLKIFKNLSEIKDTLLEETLEKCKLSLQGHSISFAEVFDDKIREFVTPREIFQMLKGNFSIGEDNENLPKCYIPRTVSTTVFDIESIIKHSPGSVAIIFYYEDKLEQLEILIQNIVKGGDYSPKYSPDAIFLSPTMFSKQDIPTIILRKEECSRKRFDEIRKETRKDDVHLFKVMEDEKTCLLLMSTKNISKNRKYTYTKMPDVEENKIHAVFNNSINILCAQSGMGKSTLMKYLKNECDPNFWTVMVDLKAHNQFFKRRNCEIDDVLTYFLELENRQDIFLLSIKKMFLEKRKIVLFLDGLDEVENECVDYILNITRQLSEMGFRIWFSSRQNLQQKLEQYFNIFVIEINELNKDQQKKYIEEMLTSQYNYNENEIQEKVSKIFKNAGLANNREILKIPLHLQIIAQIFIDNYSSLSESDIILTKMFEIFKGKYKHFVTKFESRNPHLFKRLEEQLEKMYEIVALHSVLNDEHFRKLQIEKTKLTTEIKKSDFLGIITKVNSENKAMFQNLAFAEYFASKFLVKNFKKTHILRNEIFAEKYRNLRIIFNILQAEDSSTHFF